MEKILYLFRCQWFEWMKFSTYSRIIIDGRPKHLHIIPHLKIATNAEWIPNTPKNHMLIRICASKLCRNHIKCRPQFDRQRIVFLIYNWINRMDTIEINTTFGWWQHDGHYGRRNLCTERNEIQFTNVHHLCLNQCLTNYTGQAFAGQ